MTVTLEKSPNEPIILATLSGELTIVKVIQHIERINRLENTTTGSMDNLK